MDEDISPPSAIGGMAKIADELGVAPLDEAKKSIQYPWNKLSLFSHSYNIEVIHIQSEMNASQVTLVAHGVRDEKYALILAVSIMFELLRIVRVLRKLSDILNWSEDLVRDTDEASIRFEAYNTWAISRLELVK